LFSEIQKKPEKGQQRRSWSTLEDYPEQGRRNNIEGKTIHRSNEKNKRGGRRATLFKMWEKPKGRHKKTQRH